ncbi:MAG: thiamine pyrophosphate-requiring protein [Betaproteobacteria bacterium]|nr:MAG: thiamine pyrophosphate-requiring protein [Betaproteobacteria bacterium]
MAKTVSDFLVERLSAWGVRRIYGYPGDGINGVIGALGRADGKIQFIQPRHEEAASFMACGHAKFTGEIGVCLGTSGPGAIHLLTGLYDARADHQPVVAICGQKPRGALGSDFQQEVDLVSLFRDVAHEYVEMVTVPTQLRHVVDRAFRIALSRRVPTCIILPSDVQELAGKEPPHEHGTVHSGLGYSAPIVVPAAEDLVRAAEVLNSGKRVAMLVGAGAIQAGDEVLRVADRLGAGIAKALLGKPVLPDTIPYVTGGIGMLGTRPSYEMMRDCDTLLMVGSGFPYVEFLPEEGSARGVQIDIDARMLSLRYPMEVSLVGDAATTLRALLPLLQPKDDDRWRRTIERNMSEWWETLEKRAMQDGEPINPQRVFWELSSRLPDNVLMACDTGTSVHWYSRDLRMRKGMRGAHSGGLASMGAAVPYAVAAKFAYPDRPTMAFVGDGAMQMNGLNELITVAKYWQQWADPRFVVFVLNNRDLNMVTWEQRVLEGDPKFPTSQDLPDFSYAGYAHLLDFDGFVIDEPGKIVPTLESALASRRPAVVEILADPNIPPLPPHTTAKQAKDYLLALMKGDPDTMKVIRASAKQLFAS